MEAKAKARYIRISPRKARQVTDLIRGKNVSEAANILKFTPNRASLIISKVLKSALANAKQSADLKEEEKLLVTEVFVDQGPTLKRFRPRAMGRASSIRKKTSHITLVVGNREAAPAEPAGKGKSPSGSKRRK